MEKVNIAETQKSRKRSVSQNALLQVSVTAGCRAQ